MWNAKNITQAGSCQLFEQLRAGRRGWTLPHLVLDQGWVWHQTPWPEPDSRLYTLAPTLAQAMGLGGLRRRCGAVRG